MTVVVDATPLISLSAIRRLSLLQRFYGRIVIARAVYEEVVTQGQGRPGAAEVVDADWIETRTINNRALLLGMPAHLGKGEAETIVLARELSAELVIMDEMAGRRELAGGAIDLIGSIGVLQLAKLQRLIPALKDDLDALRRVGFHLSDRVYRACLAAVGE